MLSNPRTKTTTHFPVLRGDELIEMRQITLVPYQCTTMAWNPCINTHPNDNGRLAVTITLILSQIGPATTPPTATAPGQTWQRSGQIAWLFFSARWKLWITHAQGEKNTGARERVTGGRKGFSESSLPSCSRQIRHRGKLHHSRNKLIRDVLDDAWLKRLPVSGSISSFKKLIGPNSLTVSHDPHDSHCGTQHPMGLKCHRHEKLGFKI